MHLLNTQDDTNKFFQIENDDTVIRLEYTARRQEIFKKILELWNSQKTQSALRAFIYQMENSCPLDIHSVGIVHDLNKTGLLSLSKTEPGFFKKKNLIKVNDTEFLNALFYTRGNFKIIELSNVKLMETKMQGDIEMTTEIPMKVKMSRHAMECNIA